MNRPALGFLLLRILATCGAVTIAVWFEIPWWGIIALGLLGALAAAAHPRPPGPRKRPGAVLAVFAWICSLTVAAALSTKSKTACSSVSFALLAWLVTAAILPDYGGTIDDCLKKSWRILSMAWAFFGVGLCLIYAYCQNLPEVFYLGLLINLVLLILCKLLFRMAAFGIYFSNTLILLSVSLPLADLFFRPAAVPDAQPEPDDRYYLYENAKKDPAGYVRWCARYDWEWVGVTKETYDYDTGGTAPFRFKPNSHATFFHSDFWINSLGFRGKEITRDKADAYRVVALGESTTFDITLNREDTPWPELLERMIRDRLKLPRPVEVLNFGVPAYSLELNLNRMAKEILPLKPDMIISYHGYNGFHLIESGLPLAYSRRPVAYEERPLRLLAKCEYRLKLFLSKRRELAQLAFHASSVSDPMETEYARSYRQLIQIARTNGIHLVLANFSMAVNERSDLDVIRFYGKRFPAVFWEIKANEVHSAIVRQLAEHYPEIRFVDTHPQLDGEHRKFIDLVHFTQDGRRQLAETIFAGIKDLVEHDSSHPQPGVQPPL